MSSESPGSTGGAKSAPLSIAVQAPDEVTDQELLYAIAAGDRPSLEKLYDRHSALLLGVALSVLRSGRAEAEDLLHDVFVEIWQHAGDYDPSRGTARTWMTLRMRSRALDRLKSASRSRTTSLDETPRLERAAIDHQDPTLGPDQAKLKRALAALPSEQRDVIALQYFEGLSSSEVAERLGVPIGTVKSRTAAAMRKLQAALAPEMTRSERALS